MIIELLTLLFGAAGLCGIVAGVLLYSRLLLSSPPVGARVTPWSSAGDLSIIIPARNEEERLPLLLSSLREAQHPGETPPIEVIVVDDESEDRTRLVGEAFGCTVVGAGPRPPGWIGKSWACWRGAQLARGEVLLFLDADTRFLPGGLSALAELFSRAGGLVSIQPYHRTEWAVERLSSFFNLVVMAATGAFGLNNAGSPPDGSFGPCMMIGRRDYGKAGGHRAVMASLIEDMALGRACAARGIRVSLHAGRGIIEYRMYPGGFGEILEGWTKNLASGASTAPPAVRGLISLWLGGMATSLLSIACGFSALLGANPGAMAGAIVGAAAYLLTATEIALFSARVGNFGFVSALLFPVHLGFFCTVLVRSLYLQYVKHEVQWKGRTIKTNGVQV
ncbi:MAG TPA: glycosyltransferase family 2 protein [Spirochaetia bacterium]|nr:glycosyltransferase family 2 protein [Spirochaetia bacterium]